MVKFPDSPHGRRTTSFDSAPPLSPEQKLGQVNKTGNALPVNEIAQEALSLTPASPTPGSTSLNEDRFSLGDPKGKMTRDEAKTKLREWCNETIEQKWPDPDEEEIYEFKTAIKDLLNIDDSGKSVLHFLPGMDMLHEVGDGVLEALGVTELSIYSSEHVAEDINSALARFPAVTHLSISLLEARELPESITSLKNLEVLEVSGSSSLNSLPADLSKLQSLHTISMPAPSHDFERLGGLTGLRNVAIFAGDTEQLISAFEQLPPTVQNVDLSELEDLEPQVIEALSNLPDLRTLKLPDTGRPLPPAVLQLTHLHPLNRQHLLNQHGAGNKISNEAATQWLSQRPTYLAGLSASEATSVYEMPLSVSSERLTEATGRLVRSIKNATRGEKGWSTSTIETVENRRSFKAFKLTLPVDRTALKEVSTILQHLYAADPDTAREKEKEIIEAMISATTIDDQLAADLTAIQDRELDNRSNKEHSTRAWLPVAPNDLRDLLVGSLRGHGEIFLDPATFSEDGASAELELRSGWLEAPRWSTHQMALGGHRQYRVLDAADVPGRLDGLSTGTYNPDSVYELDTAMPRGPRYEYSTPLSTNTVVNANVSTDEAGSAAEAPPAKLVVTGDSLKSPEVLQEIAQAIKRNPDIVVLIAGQIGERYSTPQLSDEALAALGKVKHLQFNHSIPLGLEKLPELESLQTAVRDEFDLSEAPKLKRMTLIAPNSEQMPPDLLTKLPACLEVLDLSTSFVKSIDNLDLSNSPNLRVLAVPEFCRSFPSSIINLPLNPLNRMHIMNSWTSLPSELEPSVKQWVAEGLQTPQPTDGENEIHPLGSIGQIRLTTSMYGLDYQGIDSNSFAASLEALSDPKRAGRHGLTVETPKSDELSGYMRFNLHLSLDETTYKDYLRHYQWAYAEAESKGIEFEKDSLSALGEALINDELVASVSEMISETDPGPEHDIPKEPEKLKEFLATALRSGKIFLLFGKDEVIVRSTWFNGEDFKVVKSKSKRGEGLHRRGLC